MSDHAFLAPSSASAWGPGGCPAYPRMAAAFPEDGSTLEAREGDAAHWYVSETALGRRPEMGAVAPNGHPVNEEMAECAWAMVTDICAKIEDPAVMTATEQRVEMPEIHPTLNWGRMDFGAIDPTKRILYAWDFKYGHGYVDVFENWQLVDYAVGAARHFGVTIDHTWTIDNRIYQPRSFHEDGQIKRWVCDGARFLELRAQLAAAATAAVDPDAPMVTGVQCHHCPARHACPALKRVGGVAMDMSLRGVPLELEPENAGLLLRMVRTARERLEDLETGLDAYVSEALRSGVRIPGWEMKPGTARERWTQPVADVLALGAVLGVDLQKPVEPITPAQARKKGIDAAVISAYSERPPGAVKLQPVDEKDIRKAFQ